MGYNGNSNMEGMTLMPDTTTRAGRQAAAGKVQFAVRDKGTGFTCYVMIEPKRKKDGGGYEKGTVPLAEATHVFISEKGYGTPRIGTYYPPKPGYDTGRFFIADDQPGQDAPHVLAMRQVALAIAGVEPESWCEVKTEDRCAMCWHKLEDPESIERGIGPECAGKPTATKILHTATERKLAASPQAPLDVPEAEFPPPYWEKPEQTAGDEIHNRIQQIRDEKDSVQAVIAEAQARLRQLEAQEAELTEDVPF